MWCENEVSPCDHISFYTYFIAAFLCNCIRLLPTVQYSRTGSKELFSLIENGSEVLLEELKINALIFNAFKTLVVLWDKRE